MNTKWITEVPTTSKDQLMVLWMMGLAIILLNMLAFSISANPTWSIEEWATDDKTKIITIMVLFGILWIGVVAVTFAHCKLLSFAPKLSPQVLVYAAAALAVLYLSISFIFLNFPQALMQGITAFVYGITFYKLGGCRDEFRRPFLLTTLLRIVIEYGFLLFSTLWWLGS